MRYSEDYKKEALDLSNEIGVRQSAKAAGISTSTLLRWRKEAQGKEASARRYFSAEERAEILLYARENNYKEACIKYGVSRAALYNWAKRSGVRFEYVPINWDKVLTICKALHLSVYGLACGCLVSRATILRWRKIGMVPRHKMANICMALSTSERVLRTQPPKGAT